MLYRSCQGVYTKANPKVPRKGRCPRLQACCWESDRSIEHSLSQGVEHGPPPQFVRALSPTASAAAPHSTPICTGSEPHTPLLLVLTLTQL